MLDLKEEFHYPLQDFPAWALLDCQDKNIYQEGKDTFLKLTSNLDEELLYKLDPIKEVWIPV